MKPTQQQIEAAYREAMAEIEEAQAAQEAAEAAKVGADAWPLWRLQTRLAGLVAVAAR
jgi:hypothetical protein